MSFSLASLLSVFAQYLLVLMGSCRYTTLILHYFVAVDTTRVSVVSCHFLLGCTCNVSTFDNVAIYQVI